MWMDTKVGQAADNYLIIICTVENLNCCSVIIFLFII